MVSIGQLYYAPHRRMWGVWKRTELGGTFVRDFHTKEEARDFVYEKNNWKQNN